MEEASIPFSSRNFHMRKGIAKASTAASEAASQGRDIEQLSKECFWRKTKHLKTLKSNPTQLAFILTKATQLMMRRTVFIAFSHKEN